jgi:hypothetical protein
VENGRWTVVAAWHAVGGWYYRWTLFSIVEGLEARVGWVHALSLCCLDLLIYHARRLLISYALRSGSLGTTCGGGGRGGLGGGWRHEMMWMSVVW